eukprot:Skav230082  [mRNA]  locus=scaffold2569:285621:290051:+ [translate_table: standard]
MGITQMNVMIGQTPAVVHMTGAWCKQIVVGMEFTVQNYKVVWYEAELHFYCNQPDSIILLHPTELRGSKQIIEAFSGLGGWTNACEIMKRKVHMLVERDSPTARVSAKQHGVPLLTAAEYVKTILNQENIEQCVLNDSITNPVTWVAIGLANPEALLGSPPCQPWSGSGSGMGLSCEDGMAMMPVLGWAGKLRIPTVVLENVPGLCRHDDYRSVLQEAQKDGLIKVLADTHQCSAVLPVRRERWLAVFVHCTVCVQDERIQMAASVKFTNHLFNAVCLSPSLSDAGAVHSNMSESERNQLAIDDCLRDAMGKSEFAPQWLKRVVTGNQPEDFVNARTIKPHQQLGAVMALYGRQHMLSEDALKSRGLQTMVFQDHVQCRLLSPWEIIAALGFPAHTVLHCDLEKAWTMTGNAISVAHAWIALYQTHIALHETSPFHPEGNASDQIKLMLKQCMKLDEYETVVDGDFWFLTKSNKSHEPDAKKQKLGIPATVPFVAQEFPECSGSIATVPFHKAPAFLQQGDPRLTGVQGNAYAGGLVILQHEQKHWMMTINCASGESVGDIIQRGLPHAQPKHFHAMVGGSNVLAWDSVIQSVNCFAITFSPTSTPIVCMEQSLNIALTLQCDLTWTIKSGLAFCAARLGCHMDTLALLNEGHKTLEDDYMLEFRTPRFEIAFNASIPQYVKIAPEAQAIQDSGIQVAPASFVRFFGRHPTKKVTRTVALPQDGTLTQLVQALFPDLHATTPWTVYDGNEVVPPDAFASAWKVVQIQWNTLRPLRITEVAALQFTCGLDAPSTIARLTIEGIKRFCRSPFEVKSKQLMMPPTMTVGEVAASYLCYNQIKTGMLCSVNGAIIDPTVQVKDINEYHTIDFRICPLLGGAKHDGIKKRVRELLQSHGVPEELVGERLNQLLSQCPLERIAVYKDNDDDELWTNLKQLATTTKVRLVKVEELKALQMKQKQSKSSSSGIKKDVSKNGKKEQPKAGQPAAHEIVVDPTHFEAEGQPVQILEFGRFGPDQTGLCVATPAQAQQVAQAQHRSADALALLVVGKGAEKFGNTFSMPAHSKQGAPLVVAACLIQYGDIPIDYALQIPNVTVNQVESTVIEFTIERKHVSEWSATQVPLHYLGVHIPPLRGSNLLAVWSVKAWEGQKLASHANASHYHGFFRVQDTLMYQTLGRSGSSGIFLCPKTINKKHDPRFVAIAVPSASLQETVSKAETCTNSLGVVRMGGTFAIRCRREHSARVRSAIMPETAFVEMANIDQDADLYILRHAPLVCRDELSTALKEAGWPADAVKSQGSNRWIIASHQPPPASHFGINGSIVIVEKMMGGQAPKLPMIIATASEMKVDTVRDQANQVISTTTTTRFAELRAEIEDQVTAVMDARLQEANQQIEMLTTALQEIKRENNADMLHLKTEQEFQKKKLQDMESNLSATGQAIVSQMKNMFASMEKSMSDKIEGAVANLTPVESELKRAKMDQEL